MSAFFSQVFSLLTSPQGNLIYQLVLAFSIAGALQPAYIHWRESRFPTAARTALGLTALLGAVALMFGLGALAWRGLFNPALVLPPVDRAITAIYLIAVIWLWAFPHPSREGDTAAVLLAVLVAALGILNLATSDALGSTLEYNHTPRDLVWQAFSILLIAVGAGLLLIRRTEGYMVGLAFLALAFLGHAAHLLVPEPGSFSGAIRLAYLAAFPLLLTLAPHRAGVPAGSPTVVGQQGAAPSSKRYGTDGKTAAALLGVAAATGGPQIYRAVARAVAHTVLADLCFVTSVNEEKGQLLIEAGYDLIREADLPGTRIDMTSVPRLANAVQRARPLRLSASGTSADLNALALLLDLPNPGNLLSVPVVPRQSQSPAALLLLSPYSQRSWNAQDESFLLKIAESLAPVLEPGPQEAEPKSAVQAIDGDLGAAGSRLIDLERRNDELTRQLEAATLDKNGATTDAAEFESLLSVNQKLKDEIQQLRRELEITNNGRRLAESQLEAQLQASLKDLAHVQNQLAVANQEAPAVERETGGEQRRKEQAEAIVSLSQELRQPMSSIIGYTDLLLGESVGILGALQQKFIERIKASTERMGGLIDDMIQLNTLEVGLSELKPEAMDLNIILDNALAYTSSQVREKKISIHLDLSKRIPAVNADREALQQILIHLLQNAGAATPMDGSIRIKVQNTADEGNPSVLIQVTDSGGGIPAEDLPRVFTRLYRADNVLIQGVGDTGVGLSIAKTLTEAQHGRIWVESQPGAGATFNVLLPAVGGSREWRPSAEPA